MVNLVEIEIGKEVEDYKDEETGNDHPRYEAFADEGVLLSRSLVIQQVLLLRGTRFFTLVAQLANECVMSSSMEAVEKT